MPDITYRVVAQNPDGTFTVAPAAPNNPYAIAPPAGPPAPMQPAAPAGAYAVNIGGRIINFASEADYRNALDAMGMGGGGRPQWNQNAGNGSGNSGTNFLRSGADAAEAVANFLNARNLQSRRRDLQNALAAAKAAKDEINQQSGNPLVKPLVDYVTAQEDIQEISLSILDDEIFALQLQAGVGVARVMADFWAGSNNRWAGNSDSMWPAIAAGGIGLGVGYLLSSSRGNRSTSGQ